MLLMLFSPDRCTNLILIFLIPITTSQVQTKVKPTLEEIPHLGVRFLSDFEVTISNHQILHFSNHFYSRSNRFYQFFHSLLLMLQSILSLHHSLLLLLRSILPLLRYFYSCSAHFYHSSVHFDSAPVTSIPAPFTFFIILNLVFCKIILFFVTAILEFC